MRNKKLIHFQGGDRICEETPINGKTISDDAYRDEIKAYIRKLRINGLKENTLERYEGLIKEFYEVTGLKTIEKLTMDHIDIYKEDLVERNLKSGRWRLGAIKTYIKRSGKPEIALRVENLKGRREIPDILTQDEVDKLYQEAKNYTSKRYGKELAYLYRAIISTLYYSGLRRFELCNLTLDDIDTVEYSIKVVNGKGGRSAIIPVSKQCIKDIKSYLKYRRDVDSDRLFISTMGNPICPDSVSRAIKILSIRAGIKKKVTAHTLRRSIATHLIENGASPYVVKHQLRHCRLNTTDLYVNLSKKLMQEKYNEYVKPTLGMISNSSNSVNLNKLNELLIEGKISERIYEMIREDIITGRKKPIISEYYDNHEETLENDNNYTISFYWNTD